MGGRRKKHVEEENAERWLLTYADMITLLVAFFMMMYSMSVLNLEKFKAAAIGIRSGFNGPSIGKKQSGNSIVERGISRVPLMDAEVVVVPPRKPKMREIKNHSEVRRPPSKNKKPAMIQMRKQRVDKLTKQLNRSLIGVVQGDAARITQEHAGVAIELVGDLIFFPKGTAHLSAEAKKILMVVNGVLSSLENEISVEGYTSYFTANDEKQEFSNSWELSTARAMAVVNYFMETKKINPKRISVTGYGQYRPHNKKSKTSSPAQNENDRVRIFIYQD